MERPWQSQIGHFFGVKVDDVSSDLWLSDNHRRDQGSILRLIAESCAHQRYVSEVVSQVLRVDAETNPLTFMGTAQ
jgi:hypothetical protein